MTSRSDEEPVSWPEETRIEDPRTTTHSAPARPQAISMSEDAGRQTTVANEFTVVTVHKVLTRNGERLEIASPRLGFRIQLDAMQLESLSWQPKEVFSEFLHNPYGPGHH
ncbi:MAG TPA: hypothetical protein VH084_29635 [Mycobacterium sp.]|nr:hypothetical protein [Mycobacterium sp.]